MSNHDPYQAPGSSIDKEDVDASLDETTFNHLSGGQKLAIYSILIYFATGATASVLGGLAVLLLIAALILGIVGFVRILLGSDLGAFAKGALFIAMFIPVLNLFALARISSIATNALRAAGYRVGFFGAKGGYAG